jgi:hypothetical protein
MKSMARMNKARGTGVVKFSKITLGSPSKRDKENLVPLAMNSTGANNEP